jgi:hypothetical protein
MLTPDGVACSHPGCLSHRTHPCEGCGRIAGMSKLTIGQLFKSKQRPWADNKTLVHMNKNWVVLESDPYHWNLPPGLTPEMSLIALTKTELLKQYNPVVS